MSVKKKAINAHEVTVPVSAYELVEHLKTCNNVVDRLRALGL